MKYNGIVVFLFMAVTTTAQEVDASRTQNLARYVGKYEKGGYMVQIVLNNGVLSLAVPGAPLQRLIPLTPGQFKSEVFENELFIFEEKNARIERLVSKRPGLSIKFKRISDVPDDLNSGDSILTHRRSTVHFSFMFSDGDVAYVDTVGKRLEKDYVRILRDFKLDSVPVICVRIYPDMVRFHSGINYPAASDNIIATAFGKDEIRMVSPASMGNNSSTLIKGIVHELVHCVHLNVDYAPNNPRWLWEGLAMFESDWFYDPSEIDAIRKKKFPRLSDIGGGLEYELGYSLIEAIRDIWGFDTLIKLVRHRGDVNIVLGLSQKQFETQVFDHIYKKYVERKYDRNK